MSRIRSRDTKAEILFRRALRAVGLRRRYRLCDRRVFGCPDVAFRASKVAVFVDGDFWHGRTRVLPKSNRDFWKAKIRRNRLRDRAVTRRLTREGWIVMRIWESDVLKDPVPLARVISDIVRARLSK